VARVTATGQTFSFKAGDKLKTLKPGSPVYADFTKKQVSLDPDATPCCSIVGISGEGKPAPAFTPVEGATGAKVAPAPHLASKLCGRKPRIGSLVVEGYLPPAAIRAAVLEVKDGKRCRARTCPFL